MLTSRESCASLRAMAVADIHDSALFLRLVDRLYAEAMLITDEARSYFDGYGIEERDRLDVVSRLTFSCESLKITTRMTHIIAWLLMQRAWCRAERGGGAISDDGTDMSRHALALSPLGPADRSDEHALSLLPQQAQCLVRESMSLYARVERLQHQHQRDDGKKAMTDDGMKRAVKAPSFRDESAGSVRELLNRLERSIG